MLIRVAAVGQRMPAWVNEGWQEYARRMTGPVQLELSEVPMQRRGRNADIPRLVAQEGKALMNAVPKGGFAVALDQGGRAWSTTQLAEQLADWMAGGRDACLWIGGPDGLSVECMEGATSRWSLGPLTLPHPLVRIVVAEQLYRAMSIIHNHPYHRA